MGSPWERGDPRWDPHGEEGTPHPQPPRAPPYPPVPSLSRCCFSSPATILLRGRGPVTPVRGRRWWQPVASARVKRRGLVCKARCRGRLGQAGCKALAAASPGVGPIPGTQGAAGGGGGLLRDPPPAPTRNHAPGNGRRPRGGGRMEQPPVPPKGTR